MKDNDDLELDKICKELLKAFKGILSWKWDDRFETVLAEFDVASKDKVRTILNKYFRSAWDISSIDRAPLCVKDVNTYLGDLRTGQMLFTSDTIPSAYIYCAWWPWGNGTTISIRIAPCYKTLSDKEKDEKIQQFKGLFGC